MPLADDLLRFAAAFTDESVGLQTPDGLVQITRSQLRDAAAGLQHGADAYHDLQELRTQVGSFDPEDTAIRARLEDYIERLTEADLDIDPQLRAVLGEAYVEDHDPGLVDLVTGALQAIGVAEANDDTAKAMLDLISTYVDGQEGGTHRRQADQPLVQAPPAADVLAGLADQLRGGGASPVRASASPAAAAGFRAPQRHAARVAAPVNPAQRTAPLFPPGGLPTPANPGPFHTVSAEELFGLQRGGNGRYDAGAGLNTNGNV